MAEIIEEPTALSKVIALKFKINDVDVPKTTQLPTNKQFNTTDTDAWFTFELDGLASTSGTYDLTLINLDDKSIFHHADVIFAALPFHYKLNSSEDVTLNEIRHAGRWLGQLVVTMSNGDTTARQFGFNIAGHILDGQDAQVILLSDYQALINTINLAKDDLAQYNVDYAALIADVTTAEGLREQAEIDRAAAFAALVESEMIAQNVATKLADKEATFAPRMLSLESELADIEKKEINALYPPIPLIACAGDGVTDDTSRLQSILDTANANGFNKVYLPPTATGYAINGTLNLYSGIYIFGNKTKIITASKASVQGVFFGAGLSNVSVRSFRFFSVNNKTKPDGRNGLSSNVIAVQLSTCVGIDCEDLFGDQLEYLIKISSSSSDIKLRNIKTTNTHQSIYIGASTDLFLDALNLGCPTEANTDSLDHALYLANVMNVQVGQITCKQGKGYAIHIFHLPESPSKNLNFKNVILNNVRAGIVAYSAKGINFGNVVIDGINSSSGSASAITCSLDSELFVSNLKISNIGNLRGGALFSVSAPTSGILKILGGIVDNAGTNVIAQMETNGDLSVDNVLFNLCEGRFASSATAAHKYASIKSCTFIRNSTPATTPPSTELFRLQGTLLAEIEGNTFVNAQSNGRAIIYCTDNTGMVVAKNNTIKGDSLLISPSDTKTKGSNNFDANNNRVDSAVQFRNTAAGEGLVLKTPDGTKLYKISVGNDGIVTTTLTS